MDLRMENKLQRVLICSVGYGQGHHAAAAALAEEYARSGAQCHVCDPCALARPRIFSATQAYYHFCVHEMPWLWRVTYAQTDTANWRKAVGMPVLRSVKDCLRELLEQRRPDWVICTYPLYSYMLDALRAEGAFHGRYAVVVTDALEISRPWMQSDAPHVFVTDNLSARMVQAQFGLAAECVRACGFPVRRAFAPSPSLVPPSPQNLKIVLGVYRPLFEIARLLRALWVCYPAAHVTLLAGAGAERCRRMLASEIARGRAEVLSATNRMAELFSRTHVYIGKAGAATMFECYAARVPMVVNYALPGQEQGNLELLMRDGAGRYAESPDDVVQALQALVDDDAAGWQRMRVAMAAAGYDGAAARIVEETKSLFSL